MHPIAAPGTAKSPLLAANDLRVDVDGVPACDGLTLETRAERVVVLGAPSVLFAAATGLLGVARGSLSVRGEAPALAALEGHLAGAAMEPPVPLRFTPRQYVTWSARLASLAPHAARASAGDALEKLALGAMADTPLGRLVPHARRATVVAAALATGAEIVALEDPLGGLADEAGAAYAKILARALADRAWVVFAPRLPLTSALALAAEEAIVATATDVLAQGPPAELGSGERRYLARFIGPLSGIAPALEARGARAEDRGAHVLLDLGAEMTTGELLAVCAAAGVAVVDLVPVSRPLW